MHHVTKLRRGAVIEYEGFCREERPGGWTRMVETVERGTVDFVFANGQVEFSKIERKCNDGSWKPLESRGLRVFALNFRHVRSGKLYTSFKMA